MQRDPHTFIFLGRSGSGKGTQVKLLSEYLTKEDPNRKVLRIALGARVREFITGSSFTSKLAHEENKRGGLLPEFLTTWIWAQSLVDDFTGDEHLIFDGTPRKENEAHVLDDAIVSFYNRQKPWVIFLDISEDTARERLRARGREDDKTPGDVERRLEWYKTDVEPTLAFFTESPNYEVLRVNGEQSVEAIHKDIVEKLTQAWS